MITCTYCGNLNPDGRTACQYCGASLSPVTNRGESSQGQGFQQPVQPQRPVQSPQSAQSAQASELPAWLESLRSDAPARSSSPSSFSAADFVEEGDLPRWMQPNNEPEAEKDEEPRTPTLRSASSSSPNTDESYVRNISAHDLIDEQMLPDWMRGGGAGNANVPLSEQRNIAASSLIQQDNVPDWMRNFPQGQQGQAGQFDQPVTPSASTPSYQQQAPQGYPSQPLSAHDFIDQQSLPQWLREGSQGGQSGQNGQPGQPAGSQPDWNAPSQGRDADESRGTNAPGVPAKGFSASSLVDMNSLPTWMSQGGPMASPSYQQQGQGVQQPVPPQQTPSQQGGLPASSLIDVNALPDWLRAASEQGQPAAHNQPASPNQGMNGMYGINQGQGYGTPPRSDNMRVPSRPRGEMGMNEGNEAAANAFASMLGVASNAPQFPQASPYPTSPVQQAQSMPPVPPSSPQYPNNAFAVQAPLNMGQAGQQAPYMNNIGVAQVPPTGTQPAGGYPMSGQPMGAQPGQYAAQYNQAQGQPQQQHPSSQFNQEKPQKRGGLFEAIRNFFFRQS